MLQLTFSRRQRLRDNSNVRDDDSLIIPLHLALDPVSSSFPSLSPLTVRPLLPLPPLFAPSAFFSLFVLASLSPVFTSFPVPVTPIAEFLLFALTVNSTDCLLRRPTSFCHSCNSIHSSIRSLDLSVIYSTLQSQTSHQQRKLIEAAIL